MTDLFMSDLFITNTKDHPCISPPLYKPIKNRLRKYISPVLIVGGLRYCITAFSIVLSFLFQDDLEKEDISILIGSPERQNKPSSGDQHNAYLSDNEVTQQG